MAGSSVLILNTDIFITIGAQLIAIAAPVNRIKRHSNFVVDTINPPPHAVFVRGQQNVAVLETRAKRGFLLFVLFACGLRGNRAAITIGCNVTIRDRKKESLT